MSIQIEVPLLALGQPGVTQALSDLMSALGDHAAEAVFTGPAPTHAAARAEAARRVRRRPQASRRSPAQDIKSLPEGERWAHYFATLPDNSQRFLKLLESKGRLTVEEAVERLGLKGPKAMGGLTGAMSRWAPKQGVTLPFDAVQDGAGRRCWVWTG